MIAALCLVSMTTFVMWALMLVHDETARIEAVARYRVPL